MVLLHDRKPVIVPESHWHAWLDIKGTEESLELIHETIMAYTVILALVFGALVWEIRWANVWTNGRLQP